MAICHCENGGLMVLPICVNDCLKVFAKVARWIFVSNGGFLVLLICFNDGSQGIR